MQDQLTNGGANLQQQQGGLQQNTPGLQQNGSPQNLPNTSNLNQAQLNQKLFVETQGQSTSQPAPPAPVQGGNMWFWALILVPVCVAIALFWPEKKKQTTVAAVAEPVASAPKEPTATPKSAKKSAKPKKKQSKRKRSGKK